MFYDGIVIAILVALFRGGRFSPFADMNLKKGWVFPILLVFQIMIFSLQNKYELIGQYSNLSFMVVYVLGLYFLWINRNLPGFNIILFGVFLNFIVMALNGGRMPVSLEASTVLDPYYMEALTNNLYGKHAAITDSTKLAFLGDIIPLSHPYPKTRVISIGDIVMNIGAFIFIQKIMLSYKK
ncbi:DUF5317 domain-containing protein [Sutcliffiella cohnii]|uniref:DUF5317 domain-containing protein n=1 Tax=Sutcliffiella cohnii TaxID=33932 RepID=UPI002E1BB3B9|nr:DUF5317 domain-containing protein [Sutcliffiella cohnii]